MTKQLRTFTFTHFQEYRGLDIEYECEAFYDATPGEKGSRDHPGAAPEVNIHRVEVVATGEDITPEVDLDSLSDDILEYLGTAEEDAAYDAAEAQGDSDEER